MATKTVRKTKCPAGLTEKKFKAEAVKQVKHSIMGAEFLIDQKVYKSGTFGWWSQERVKNCTVAGEVCTLLIQTTISVVGSSDAARE